ncbi:MAG: ATP-binding protein [Halieaceae bacterium]|nr:ATP-binding protein [Halieaceae bacterium]
MPELTTHRYIADQCREDLTEKLVFIGGPRQVGKTTLALHLLGATAKHPAYLNWDIDSDRNRILHNELPPGKLLIFDEIHKYARWRGLLKGFYDQHFPRRAALVTGSARLDHYRKGGDSLQGRYHYFRLHPYSLAEISSRPNQDDLNALLKFGGFPEPLAKQNTRHWRRWRLERQSRVLMEDLVSLERVNEISLLELLYTALLDRVSAPLSLQSLRQQLQVSHDSVRRWLTIFDNLYLTFRISPYGAPSIRAVKKEQKLYFWDWSVLTDPGARFENLVASQLLKYCHFQEDREGYAMELRYLRDTGRREVDFVVIREHQPLFAVECKVGDRELAPQLKYFKERTDIPAFYQVHLSNKDYQTADGIRVLPFRKFVAELGLP